MKGRVYVTPLETGWAFAAASTHKIQWKGHYMTHKAYWEKVIELPGGSLSRMYLWNPKLPHKKSGCPEAAMLERIRGNTTEREIPKEPVPDPRCFFLAQAPHMGVNKLSRWPQTQPLTTTAWEALHKNHLAESSHPRTRRNYNKTTVLSCWILGWFLTLL